MRQDLTDTDEHYYVPHKSSIIQALSLSLHSSTHLLLGSFVLGEFGRTFRDRRFHDLLFQVVQDLSVVVCQERDGHSRLSSTTSTTNTMDILFDATGHLEVDDK